MQTQSNQLLQSDLLSSNGMLKVITPETNMTTFSHPPSSITKKETNVSEPVNYDKIWHKGKIWY